MYQGCSIPNVYQCVPVVINSPILDLTNVASLLIWTNLNLHSLKMLPTKFCCNQSSVFGGKV